MFYVCLIVFFIFKVFFNDFDYILTLPFGGAALYLLSKKDENCYAFLLLALLTNGGLSILLLNSVMFAWWFIGRVYGGLAFKKIEIAYLLYILAFTFLLMLHHSSVHDYLRYILLITIPALYFITLNQKFRITLKEDVIFSLFVVCVFANAVYCFILGNERNSIFSGSENIALIIFTFLFVMAINNCGTRVKKLFLLTLYVLFLITLSSRSVLVLVPVLGLCYFPVLKFRYQAALVVSAICLCLALVPNHRVSSENEFNRIGSLVSDLEFIRYGDYEDLNFEAFNHVDIRARLYSEASVLFGERPWIGHGALNPKVFDELTMDGDVNSFHSSLADVLVSYGIFGLLAIMVFLYSVYLKVSRNLIERKYLLKMSFYSFIVVSLIQPYFLNIQVYMLMFIIFALFHRDCIIHKVIKPIACTGKG
mgnify:CR=1 FL=1